MWHAILEDGKNRKHIRILYLILALSLIWITIIQTKDPYRQGIILANKQDLRNTDFQILKTGYYCGEGGINCDHGAGFIYYTSPLTAQHAMEKAGFEYINESPLEEYDDGGESACIQKIRKYKSGFLLYYVITGTA